jgi:hypothetical protein
MSELPYDERHALYARMYTDAHYYEDCMAALAKIQSDPSYSPSAYQFLSEGYGALMDDIRASIQTCRVRLQEIGPYCDVCTLHIMTDGVMLCYLHSGAYASPGAVKAQEEVYDFLEGKGPLHDQIICDASLFEQSNEDNDTPSEPF